MRRPGATRDTEQASDLDEAKLLLTNLRSEQLDLEIRYKRGELLPSQDVERRWVDMGQTLKAQLLAIPTSLAPAIALETDASSCESMIRQAIVEALNAVSQV